MLSHLTIHHVYQAIKWDVEGIKGGYHQQQPELQLPTLHADSPSVKPRLPRPTCMNKEESKPYLQIQAIDKHRLFFKREDRYFKSEYYSVRKLGQCLFGAVHLAIKRSSGLEVVYKIIEKGYVPFYTLESSPPPECHSTEIPALYGKYAGAGCMSPRPQNLLLPLEIEMQKYLSHPGYENSYVPRVIDYVVTEKAYILVMEYSGEDWVALDKYMTKHGKFSVDKARLIIKEVVTALIFLKKLGVLHGDIADFGSSELLEGWNQGSSTQTEYSSTASESSGGKPKVILEEIRDIKNVGYLLYRLLTLGKKFKNSSIPQEEFAKELRNSLDNPESQRTINAADLIASLLKYYLSQVDFIEDMLEHPFFTSQ
ncbi:hypothetical protein BASA61_009157 [Batrachochytrium salamandrivorans]|nr:hypothetical protein BASA61_009157 [Batrachochytrium salamandrivorans]